MKRKAKDNFIFWRLVFDGHIPPSEVFSMDAETLYEADAALDIYISKIKADAKGGGGKNG